MSSTTPIATSLPDEEQPIRAELFSVERLEQHAETLAAAQIVEADLTRGRPLTPRVLDNGRVLLESYRALAQAIQQEHSITPAAEWLVDNFHIVDEQLREIREDLPPGFYRKLPKLAAGPLVGYPRVFGVAWAFVAHTDSRFDPEVLGRFVKAYQRVQPLTIGELWAVAITLRVVLVENLRRLAERIVRSRAARQEADTLADSLLGTNGLPALPPADLLKKFEGRNLSPAFGVQLLQRLRDVNPNVGPVLEWLDAQLAEEKTTADDIVRQEHQQQAAMNVTVRNIITSMRLMSAFEWPDFFETVSLVDEILGKDTNFGELDFTTRDSYRHAIENLSRASRHTEVEIAQRVVQHVKRARIDVYSHSLPSQEPMTDPGYYLISLGRPEFEREIGYRLSWRRRALRSYMETALPGYLGTIALVTVAVMALPLLHDREAGVPGAALFFLGLLAIFPASDLAIALINRMVTDWLGPRSLPRLDLRKGVPEHLRTIVVMPVLLTRRHEVEELVSHLEIHYLANSEGNLHFALLSDWADAATETLPTDDELLAAATEGIAALNTRYGPAPGGGERFLLFHRRRVWNEEECKWMGWERKRGKLHELNQFLRGATNTTFVGVAERAPDWLLATRYVITLDADTRLPPGVTYRLVGTMAHPLNRPEFSSQAGRVVEGYGIMQPRTMPTLPTGHGGSLFQEIFSGPSGMDAYATAVSDVYHDLFREGSFTGKGIYEIDAFQAALAGKVPENALLSHDLFEGIFARTGLVTDIELFEEFPMHYETAAARAHRWVRGDWQLLPWIFGRGPKGIAQRNPVKVPAVGRWKMIDNLRRSLSAPASFLLLFAGWLLPPASPWVWTRFLILTLAIPPLLPFLIGLDPRFGGVSKRSHLRALWGDLVIGLWQAGLALTFLAYQAWLMSDAIARTLARLYVTHRNMLEWVTAAQAKYAVDFKLTNMYRRMAGGIAVAGAAGLILALGRHSAFVAAAPFLAAWMLAPAVAQWISIAPESKEAVQLSDSEEQILRVTARKTWRFFFTFVSAADHALPPDNFQEDPKPVVAHRTSPTNIGLYLLSTLAAHDLGCIGTSETVERLEETLATMSRLELFRGHFYNWYDTSDLRPLDPRYISSVDSGNLAGHLLALSRGCRELLEKPFGAGQLLAGLQDCISILREPLTAITDTKRTNIVTRKQLANAVEALAGSLQPLPEKSAALAVRLTDLRTQIHTLADIAHAFAQQRSDAVETELRAWTDATRDCMESHWRDAQILSPWTRLGTKEVAAIGKGGDWAPIEPLLQKIPRLSDAATYFASVLIDLSALRERVVRDSPASLGVLRDIDGFTDAVRKSAADAEALVNRLNAVAQTAENMFHAMDFTFLFDSTRKLFSIGYRVSDGTIDAACYDLLASEARLTSFIAIAKGDAESTHWFRLGRTLTPVDRGSALISWSGSMFEYLMPVLVMHAPEDSVLSETARLVVRRQIEYGTERGVPWGVSESAFNARDTDLRYQYSAFGVPGLGLKRGLSEDVVIAPYATAIAAMVDPVAATQNITRLMEAGAKGAYGLYEALDYTATRVPEGKKVAVIQAYFAHHQGMTLVSLANVLTGGLMQSRFHAAPIVKAVELLLQEKTPRDVLVARPRAEEVSAARVRELVPPVLRRFLTPHEASPRTQLLSNGRYAVMLTSAGSGYSRWRDIAVTRWREDATRDCWGSYIYLRDSQTGQIWSAGHQPAGVEAESYEACFFEDRAEIQRRDRSVDTLLEVVVSSDDDAELRRVSITNHGLRTREIQVTSYSEICLTSQAADAAHPAFSNLFVETEFNAETGALLATRRSQSGKDAPVWLAHVTAFEGETVGSLEYETDRSQFIGRSRGTRNPVSIFDATPLAKNTGPVLDPIVSLRRTMRIPPGTTARVIFSTIIASTREQALELADKHRDATTFERTLTLAWTQAQVQLRHLGVDPDEANLFQRLANAILYADAALRPSSDALSRASLDLASLWSQGISGDRPIVLAFIDESDDIEIIRQLLRAHEYWRMKNLPVDVVIVNEKAHSYAQDLHGALESLVRGNQLRVSPESGDALGNIYLLKADLLSPQLRAILQSVARAVLFGRRGTLSEQINRSQRSGPALPPVPAEVSPARERSASAPAPLVLEDLAFANGLGGFDENGREYVVVLGEGVRTPQPWINVIANPSFGFIVSESGAGFTWSVNSHENQLTPWSNDPVSDPPAEALYIRDQATGEIWSPTALPVRDEASTYICRHGQGYSRFEHSSHGIRHELTQFVPLKDPVKISRLTLQNTSSRTRHLSIAAYAEWALGSSRSAEAPYIVTEADSKTGAVFARNSWEGEFAGRIAFADLGGKQASFTCDRKEFIGRNGTMALPAALARDDRFSGKVGAGLDPCAALLASVELRPGGRAEIVFFLGQAENRVNAQEIILRYRAANLDDVLREVVASWEDVLGAVCVTTPEPALDVMLNRWLLYQTLVCRVWGRAAFYQVSGAYGFRDQLQDVLALCIAKREVAREHLLRAASRQFAEGDVQHWWHPPSGRGVRTRISDDLLWLPYAMSRFIEVTGDTAVLDEPVPFLEGDTLAEGQEVSYFQPRTSENKTTLFEHCARAIDRSLAVGAHGLPLMGTGDWNDGMNLVGEHGKGESVWLAWFMHLVLSEFAQIADSRGEGGRAETWRLHVTALKAALEREAWDGDWYRRAYFDDGTPLGSAQNEECKIDSIAQTWGVISGAAEPGRAQRAMTAVDQNLVRRRDGLILLLDPPFDHAAPSPGYIRGYVPGIRENGGQYTHAAAWTVFAFAALGDGERAGEMFRMLNPINHTRSRADVQRYKVEPYVVAGDIYSEPPHVARGGWTWYSGSAGWLYRVGLESILGFRLRGMSLSIDPCVPRNWSNFSISFRYHSTTYKIKVENPSSVMRGIALTRVDGKMLPGKATISLVDDGAEHEILVVMG